MKITLSRLQWRRKFTNNRIHVSFIYLHYKNIVTSGCLNSPIRRLKRKEQGKHFSVHTILRAKCSKTVFSYHKKKQIRKYKNEQMGLLVTHCYYISSLSPMNIMLVQQANQIMTRQNHLIPNSFFNVFKATSTSEWPRVLFSKHKIQLLWIELLQMFHK